ncbi:MAG: AcrR family transcriptional regulator [Oleiphilaceae bacterium]|jgi:AcrR family transcriptional regulator
MQFCDDKTSIEKPMSHKQREFARREQEILSAAISLFEDPHWETVTVENISKKAEIGKGTVYKHFTSKDDIYAGISINFMKRILSAYRINDERPKIIDGIKELISTSFDMFLNNPAEARVSFYCKRGDFRERLTPELRAEFEAIDNQFSNYVGTILQKGINQGLFPNRPVEHLMMGLEATFDGAMGTIWNGDVNCPYLVDQETYIIMISEYMLAGLVGLKLKV